MWKPPPEPAASAILGGALRRGWLSCAAGGISFGVLALGAWLVALGGTGLPWLSPESVGTLMRLEAYVVMTGFTFAMLLPWLPLAGRGFGVALWVALLAVIALMSWLLWSTRPDVALIAQYVAVMSGTFLGALLDPRGTFTTLAWWKRIGAMIAVFVAGVMLFDPPTAIDSWEDDASVLRLSALYFTSLACLESSGVYHLGLDEWRALGRRLRRRQ
jgi:hypothetical protein